MRHIVAVVMALALLFAATAQAGDCRKTGSVCVDSAPSKVISGVTVTLGQAGGCWEYEDTYECIKPSAINYCTAFENTPGCYQTSATCTKTAFNGTCMESQRTYRCGDNLGSVLNTIKLGDTYTIVKDLLNTTQCDPLSTNPRCVIAEHKCMDGAETRIINGLSVYKDCWRYEDKYTCLSDQSTSDCASLLNKGCTESSSRCLENYNSACTMMERVFSCQTTPAQTTTVKDCSAQMFCMDGKCFDTGHAPDADIFKVATAMEAAREAGLYMDPNSLEMFKGYGSHCAKGYGGLKNCCKTSGGGAVMNNASVMGTAMGATIQSASDYAGQTLRYGSTYVYDALYESDSSGALTQGLGAMLDLDGAATAITPTASFGMYGLTWTAGAVPTSVMGVNTISLAGQTGIQGLYFSPVGLYIAVAMIIIQELISCEPEDQILGMKRGQNLCHFAGSYCSVKVPILGTCLETTESYCCFNSRLARIINEQGRPQIGKSWGSGESPNCSGFTPAQLQGLDFSQMDLREFYAEIMANMKTPDVSQAAQKAQSTVTNKVNYYYGQ